MKASLRPLTLLFLLGLMLFPIGVRAQMGQGMAGHGVGSGWPGYNRPFNSLGEQIYYTGVDIRGPVRVGLRRNRVRVWGR